VSNPIQHNVAIRPPGVGGTTPPPATRPAPAGPPPSVSFGRVLAQQLDRGTEVRFSGHALQRLERRGIEVGPAEAARLADGVDRAAAKGSRDALVLVDGTAFVVSVANRTVITAVDSSHMKERVFTNIDSAVIS
jgi:flagellar operon protein